MRPTRQLTGGRPVDPEGAGTRGSRGRRARRLAICGLVGAISVTGLTGVATADVDPAHSIIVSKDDSIVLAEGFEVGENVLVEVVRNGVVIGSSEGPAEELDQERFPGVGFFEVNHAAAPTVCWDGHTPEILPGDTVRVTSGQPGSEVVDTVPVADIQVTEGPTAAGADTVTVKGQVNVDPVPDELDLSVETRSLDPIRFRRITPDEGTLRYDTSTPESGDFIATFGNLTAQEQEAVLNSFEVTAGYSPAPNETTLAALGATAGSEDPACPAVQRRAVTQITPGVLNIANQGADVTVSGLSASSSNVDVTLDDEDPATPAVTHANATLTGTGGAQTWTTTFSNAELAGLNGTITASGAYTDSATGTVLNGATKTLLKDVVAPQAPTASPPGGTYATAQSVTLNPVDEADTVRFRIGATGSVSDPTASSTVANGQISVTTSQTIKAAAFDQAGNRSPVLTADYVITKVPGAPTIGTASPGTTSATVRWTAPSDTGGTAITGYRVRVFQGTSTTALRTVAVGNVTSTVVSNLTNGTSYRFDVRAVNAQGSGPFSAMSNAVTPANVPTAPRIGTAGSGAAGGAVTATANWLAPTSNGGSAVTGYRVRALRMSATGAVLATTDSAMLPASARSLQMTLPSGNYRFQVRAYNAIGQSPLSARSNQVIAR